jgi:hypothetical protein
VDGFQAEKEGDTEQVKGPESTVSFGEWHDVGGENFD